MGSVDLLYPMFIFEVSLVTVQRVFARVRRFWVVEDLVFAVGCRLLRWVLLCVSNGLHKFDRNDDWSTGPRKFESIRLKIHQYLLDSHFISLNDIVHQIWILLEWKSHELCFQCDIKWISLILLNLDDIFNTFLYVNLFYYLIKLISLDLSIAKNILYIHKKKWTWWFLNLNTIFKFVDKILHFIIEFVIQIDNISNFLPQFSLIMQ